MLVIFIGISPPNHPQRYIFFHIIQYYPLKKPEKAHLNKSENELIETLKGRIVAQYIVANGVPKV